MSQEQSEAVWQRNFQTIGEIGFLASPTKNFTFGLHIVNPWEIWADSRSATGNEKIDLGAGYSVPENFNVLSQLRLDNDNKFDLSFGTEYIFAKTVALRLGARFPNISSYTFGLGYRNRKISLDVGFEQHPLLGLSSSISVWINLNGSES